jgi:hypothetical protein
MSVARGLFPVTIEVVAVRRLQRWWRRRRLAQRLAWLEATTQRYMHCPLPSSSLFLSLLSLSLSLSLSVFRSWLATAFHSASLEMHTYFILLVNDQFLGVMPTCVIFPIHSVLVERSARMLHAAFWGWFARRDTVQIWNTRWRCKVRRRL